MFGGVRSFRPLKRGVSVLRGKCIGVGFPRKTGAIHRLFDMHTSIITLSTLLSLSTALPQRNRNGGNGRGGGGGQTQQATAQQQAAQVAQGLSQAQDGSTILDDTVMVNGLPIRFKISAPADQFLPASGVPGAAAASAQGTLGANVLLHGDGGQSFFDMPNQNVQANTMGVALLAPDENLFWGGGSGLQRTDGVAHAQAVNDFIQTELPARVAVNMSNIVFTGVSGGSLLMSGFFIPAQMANYANSAVELNCGAMPPQVAFQNAASVMSQTRIHYQSTQSELQLLQDAIPQAVVAYEQAAVDAGLNANQINALQTVDNTPAGGHCEFDGQDFVDGVQTMLTSYSNVVQGGDGVVTGLGAPSNGQVATGVVGNENLQFVGGRKREATIESMVKMRWARQEVVEVGDVALVACGRTSC
ncbi:hypothetical protein CC86DRAFT_357114 [Ophiobolus disseminans]|uniref:Uncharacterized protein n=1 Tax=Ophiobolus disseminans TaxID=1469910 RepID=A0A6A6ZMM3_9PLEO|nr:hypothetical protein CC86DRAFT_357114 [Ophiobolus disseminans]